MTLPEPSWTLSYVRPKRRANARASLVKSCESTPRKTTKRRCHRRAAASTVRASSLHAWHHDAQKLRTTTRPRSDESFSLSSRPIRSRSKSGAAGFLPAETAAATGAPRCAAAMCTRSSTRSPATSAIAPIRPALRMSVHRLQRVGRSQPQRPDEAAVVVLGDLARAVVELELAQRNERTVALLERLEELGVRRHRVGREPDQRPHDERRAREHQQRQK